MSESFSKQNAGLRASLDVPASGANRVVDLYPAKMRESIHVDAATLVSTIASVCRCCCSPVVGMLLLQIAQSTRHIPISVLCGSHEGT